MLDRKSITVETTVHAPVEKVWEAWTEPEHINKWAFASDDWEADATVNDVREGGKFNTIMGAKDGSAKFDFTGTYTTVIPYKLIEYVMDDGRKVSIQFVNDEGVTKVSETFEMEDVNTSEQQKEGWQSILENFKKHAESI